MVAWHGLLTSVSVYVKWPRVNRHLASLPSVRFTPVICLSDLNPILMSVHFDLHGIPKGKKCAERHCRGQLTNYKTSHTMNCQYGTPRAITGYCNDSGKAFKSLRCFKRRHQVKEMIPPALRSNAHRNFVSKVFISVVWSSISVDFSPPLY